jgi:hypothetical protein
MTYFNFIDGGERSPTNIYYYTPIGITYYVSYSNPPQYAPITTFNSQYYFMMTYQYGNYNIYGAYLYWTPNGLSRSTIYFGARIYVGSLGYTAIGFNNVNGNAQISLTMNSNGGITVTSGTTTLATSANYLFSATSIIYLECYLNVSATTGSVIVRLNGNSTPIINISGVNTAYDTTSLPVTSFVPIAVQSNNPQSSYWRDIYVHDGTGSAPYNNFLGSVGTKLLQPTSNVSTTFTPTPTLVSVVQNKTQVFGGSDPSITFSTPTTVGNYLIAMGLLYNNFTVGSGWTNSFGYSTPYFGNPCALVYQQITTSSVGPYVPFVATGGCAVTVYEISGLSGPNFDQYISSGINTSSGTYPFGSGVSTYANELEIVYCIAESYGTFPPSLDVSFTTDATVGITSTSGFGNGQVGVVAGHRILSGPGSSLQGTVVSPSNPLVYFILTLAQPSSVLTNYKNVANSTPSLNATDLYVNASSTVGAADTFSITSLPANAAGVVGLKTFDYSYKNDTGAHSLAKTITSGTITTTGTVNYLGQNPIVLEDIYLTNPSTSGTWTTTAVNALTIGYKIVN